MSAENLRSIVREADLELSDEQLVHYWSSRLRCTPVDLLAVVGRVGRSLSLIRTELSRRIDLRGRSTGRG